MRFIKNGGLVLIICWLVLLQSCQRSDDFDTPARPRVTLSNGNSRLSNPAILLSSDTVYQLVTDLTISDGQVLSIESGTLVRVNDRITITVLEGGQIMAAGTEDNPVIFTSSSEKGSAGPGSGGASESHFWYGIHIYGNGQTGSSSGELTYLRIEYAGGNRNGGGLPSLLLAGVSGSTTVHHIQVSYSYSSGSFEIRGGHVNVSHLVSYASVGTDFYLNNGYDGKMQFLIAYRHPYFPSKSGLPGFPPFNALAGVYIENELTRPVISNLTVLGPDLQPGTGLYYTNLVSPSARVSAFVIADRARVLLRNSVLMGFPKVAFYVDDYNSALALNDGHTEIKSTVFHSNDTTSSFYLTDAAAPVSSADLKAFLLTPSLRNELFVDSGLFGFENPYSYDSGPEPAPVAGSGVLTGSDFTGVFTDNFFTEVPYRGALGRDDWFAGWTNFLPGQTDYIHQ